LLGIYWWFFDELFPVDEMLTPPFVSATVSGDPHTEFNAGDIVYLRWHFLNFRRCDATFQRKLVNSDTTEIVMLSEHHGLAPNTMGEVKYPSRLQLPAGLEPGPWAYELKGIHRCNPLRPQIVDYPPIAFRIVE
jgi:hypothetical protein